MLPVGRSRHFLYLFKIIIIHIPILHFLIPPPLQCTGSAGQTLATVCGANFRLILDVEMSRMHLSATFEHMAIRASGIAHTTLSAGLLSDWPIDRKLQIGGINDARLALNLARVGRVKLHHSRTSVHNLYDSKKDVKKAKAYLNLQTNNLHHTNNAKPSQ